MSRKKRWSLTAKNNARAYFHAVYTHHEVDKPFSFFLQRARVFKIGKMHARYRASIIVKIAQMRHNCSEKFGSVTRLAHESVKVNSIHIRAETYQLAGVPSAR